VCQPVSHLGTPLPLAHSAPPQAGWVRKVRSNLNRFAALGLKLTLSEIDMRVRDWPEESRATRQRIAYRALLAVALSHPAMEGITFWGFTDKYSWIHYRFGADEPLLLNDEYGLKPAYMGCSDGALDALLAVRCFDGCAQHLWRGIHETCSDPRCQGCAACSPPSAPSTPPPPTPPPSPSPRWVVTYIGCFVNEGALRILGHLPGGRSLSGCAEAALAAGWSSFGMEYPGGFKAPGEAQCLPLEAPPAHLDHAHDAECEDEVAGLGAEPLGGPYRMALYAVE